VDLGLTGKAAVVTGASKGIGLAVARALAQEGARVVAAARGTTPELEALAAERMVLPVALDLLAPDGPARLVERAVAELGRIDVLVNNLGRSVPRGGFLGITDDDWREMLEVNLMTAVRACRAAIPRMLEAGGGAIVNVSSVNAFLPAPALPDYSAAKAALKSLSKSLSEEFGAHGIRVNTVSPGPTSTPLWLDPETGLAARMAAARGTSADAVLDGMRGMLTLGRYSEPEEVAAVVVLLASDRAGSVTGSDWVIDSGRVKVM